MNDKEAEETLEQIADRILNKYNFIEMISNTYGVAVMEDTSMVRILKNFEVVSENWKLYQKSLALEDKESIKKILTVNTDGGIIDTGDVLINIKDIKLMYPTYRIMNNSDEELAEELKKEKNIEDFFNGGFEQYDE